MPVVERSQVSSYRTVGMNTTTHRLGLNQPATYQIKVEGRLSERWAEHFDGLTLTVEHEPDGSTLTVLTGPIVDQAALHGILNRIRDLGLPLRSVDSMAS